MKKFEDFLFLCIYTIYLIFDLFWQFIVRRKNQILVVIILTTFILWLLLGCKPNQAIKQPDTLTKKIDSLILVQTKKEQRLVLELQLKQLEIDNLKKNYENEKKEYFDFIRQNNKFKPIIFDDVQSDSIIAKHIKENLH
jgi:hypothetical protein